jgi:hypothetical protein
MMEHDKELNDILNSDKTHNNDIVPLSTDIGLDMLINEKKIKKEEYRSGEEKDAEMNNHEAILDDTTVSNSISDYQNDPEDNDDDCEMNDNDEQAKNTREENKEKADAFKEFDSREEKIRKIELLRIFSEYQRQGFSLSSSFTIHSKLSDMELEYEIIRSHKNKKNALKLSQGFLINAVQALEFMNTTYDPIGLDLVGFSEVVSLGIDDYNDVLEELYEKYRHYGRKVEPEIKLVLMISASATTFHASKKMLSGVPGMEEQLKKNPSFINKIGKKIVEEKKVDQNIDDELSKLESDKIKKNREFMSRLNKQRKQKTYTDTDTDVDSISMQKPPSMKLHL